MILNAPLLFFLVNRATSKKFTFPLDKAPLRIVLTVCRGTTFCVSNRPAILIFIPDKKAGKIVFLFLLLNLLGF